MQISSLPLTEVTPVHRRAAVLIVRIAQLRLLIRHENGIAARARVVELRTGVLTVLLEQEVVLVAVEA